MKKIIRLTESDLHRIINESVKRMINEIGDENDVEQDDFYDEEDDEGKTGQVGQVRSYSLGYMNTSNMEADAEENGYENLAEYLEDYFHEINDGTLSFTWQTLGSGYGYHGDTITEFENQLTNGHVVVKELWDQIMFDEYAPNN